MIPAEAVEEALIAVRAAMIEFGPDGHTDGDEEIARAALEAAAPYMFAHLLAFADERDNALGAIRSHITTYELRKLLGVEE